MKFKKSSGNVSQYEIYSLSLSEVDIKLLSNFFQEFDVHCLLAKSTKAALRADFENAIVYYASTGVSLETALSRLSISNLGGFYSRPPVLWYPLDDAAKIYPLSMKRGQMAVFRLSAYLKQPVVPELLQMALTFTIKRFPSFATTVKKGFFWHYLDTARRRFVVEPDSGLPCRPLRIASSGSQSFRTMYYKNRISIEFFHILTDGTGGMTFLKTLTATYLYLAGLAPLHLEGIPDINAAPEAQEMANEFDRAEKSGKGSGFMDKPAVQMSGRLSRERPFRILNFKMNAVSLKAAAEKYGATVTSYILAQMFLAGRSATDEYLGEMSIQVPVNMRKFYPSKTVRNFAMYCGIRLEIGSVTSVSEIIPSIAAQLEEKGSIGAMSAMMNSTQSMVSAVRYVPLFIKAPAARLIYGFLADKIFSNTLSNLGVVKLPAELQAHVESMDFILGTVLTNRAGCALVTCGEFSTLTIAKMTSDPAFEEKLFELLSGDGLEICVEGSEAREG